MKYYENDIYPIALVLSYDAESINKEYFNAAPNEDKEIKDNPNVKARTMFLTRRTNDYYAMAVGIIFNGEPKGVSPECGRKLTYSLDIIPRGKIMFSPLWE